MVWFHDRSGIFIIITYAQIVSIFITYALAYSYVSIIRKKKIVKNDRHVILTNEILLTFFTIDKIIKKFLYCFTKLFMKFLKTSCLMLFSIQVTVPQYIGGCRIMKARYKNLSKIMSMLKFARWLFRDVVLGLFYVNRHEYFLWTSDIQTNVTLDDLYKQNSGYQSVYLSGNDGR